MHPAIRDALSHIRRLELGEPIPAECPACRSLHTWGDGGHVEGGCHDCGRTVLPGDPGQPPEVYDRRGQRMY